MPNLGAFKHGVSWADVPTSVISPVESTPGVNVVVGSAPIHLALNGQGNINKPLLFNRYEDAVMALGYSKDWVTYDICEHMDACFVEFGMYPVIYINVFDPTKGEVSVAPAPFTLAGGQVDTGKGFIAWTIVVKDSTGTTTYVLGTDYLLSLSANNTWIVTRIAGGKILTDTATIEVGGSTPGTTPISATDIIGGINSSTGQRTGLECVEDVFQATGLVPGILICPKFSSDPSVAAAMEAKVENINGCFAATCLIDVDTSAVVNVQQVELWKNNNNIVFPRQQCLFGKPCLIGAVVGQPGSETQVNKVFNFASQQGPLMQWTDINKGNGLPYCSPSNKNLRMNSLQIEGGTELPMHLLDANYLNGLGVVTALNFIGGWRSWGNRTACYPADTDVHDMFIPVRRMFDYIGNTIVLTIWQKVDEPGNRRLIDAVVNSLQLWLDGLAATDALLGASIAFNQSENPTTELLNGHYTFHIYIAVPTPAEWLDFQVEYWIPYLDNLFVQDQSAAA